MNCAARRTTHAARRTHPKCATAASTAIASSDNPSAASSHDGRIVGESSPPCPGDFHAPDVPGVAVGDSSGRECAPPDLVRAAYLAARKGDIAARNALIALHLPLLRNIVFAHSEQIGASPEFCEELESQLNSALVDAVCTLCTEGFRAKDATAYLAQSMIFAMRRGMAAERGERLDTICKARPRTLAATRAVIRESGRSIDEIGRHAGISDRRLRDFINGEPTSYAPRKPDDPPAKCELGDEEIAAIEDYLGVAVRWHPPQVSSLCPVSDAEEYVPGECWPDSPDEATENDEAGGGADAAGSSPGPAGDLFAEILASCRTETERRIVRLRRDGRSDEAIACVLGIHRRETIRTMRREIERRLDERMAT